MGCPDVAGGEFKVRPLEQLHRLVEIRHGVDFIPVIRVEEDRLEVKRAVDKPIRCLGRFDKTAASRILSPGKRAMLTARLGNTANGRPDRAPLYVEVELQQSAKRVEMTHHAFAQEGIFTALSYGILVGWQ